MERLVRAELPHASGVRLHRFHDTTDTKNTRPPKPYAATSTAKDAYKPHARADARNARPQPAFTVGEANDINTKLLFKTKTRDEMRHGADLLVAPPSATPASVSRTSFAPANLADEHRGVDAPRQGVVPPPPASEVGRGFASTTSEGLAHLGREGPTADSETRAAFAARPLPPRGAQSLTVRIANDIGTGVHEHTVPPARMNRANYELGDGSATCYETSTAAATKPLQWTSSAAAATAPAGRRARPPISEVECGFREERGSAAYNVVTHHAPLEARVEAVLAERIERAQSGGVPIGLKQAVENDPRVRGPIGTRQAYDIVSMQPRGSHLW